MDIIAYRRRIRHVEVYIQICHLMSNLNLSKQLFFAGWRYYQPLHTTIKIKINDSKVIWHTACHIVGVQ